MSDPCCSLQLLLLQPLPLEDQPSDPLHAMTCILCGLLCWLTERGTHVDQGMYYAFAFVQKKKILEVGASCVRPMLL